MASVDTQTLTSPTQGIVNPQERITMALAYSLWDAVHTVKMVEPEDIEKYREMSLSVQAYMKGYGYRVVVRKKYGYKKP